MDTLSRPIVRFPAWIAALAALAAALLGCAGSRACAADVYLRFKVVQPAGDRFRASIGGFRHADPWYFPDVVATVAAGAWSDWIDLSKWKWHGRLDRVGGIAEWPAVKITISRSGSDERVRGCALAVELNDRPDGAAVLSFTEKGESNTIGFLVPNPLREHASEFETGSQMATRHRAWADQATGGKRIALNRFGVITSIWGHYDPGLARAEAATLRELGFNVVNGTDAEIARDLGLRTYGGSFLYEADPAAVDKNWKAFSEGPLARERATPEGAWKYGTLSHWVVSDEVSTVDFRSVEPERRNGWFRAWLRERGVTDAELGGRVDEAAYPGDAMYAKTPPAAAPLAARRLFYYAAKFGHWWSARQLRHCSDVVKASLPGVPTETLPTDHGFFNAWGPPYIGMGYRTLDLFELAAQHSVDQLSAEDWLGLNHMYGPGYTWTGAQSFAYFSAIIRSAIGDRPIAQRGLITPSDDRYLRLKAYSAIGQGAKSFFFWTYGPTYIGTENYWSDLRSEYDGISKLGRALAKAENLLVPAKPERDPVAILYSVSHDIWHTDDPAAFVEKRLLWHALRHDSIQPDFLREEDVEAGRLKGYKALYITDWCVTRLASAAIDAWVRAGGVVYLSAGAATRDEFCEPYVPPFAATVWPDGAAGKLVTEKHAYNERTDLPTIKPITMVTVHVPPIPATAPTGFGRLSSTGPLASYYPGFNATLPAIGCRLTLRAGTARPFATFDDGAPAGATVPYGRGNVVAVGFLPMLAYGQRAGFKPTTLEERWPEEPRELIQIPLRLGGIRPVVRTSVPVVEASLLTGPAGSAIVLANYTYRPIQSLKLDVTLRGPIGRAVSTDGRPIRQTKTPHGVRLELPLDWTDIVLVPNGK
jgi:hypothetical protein